MIETRDNKGITLTSLIVYIISLLFAIAILVSVVNYYRSNLKDMNEYTTDVAEFDKFNLYFLEEVKVEGNGVERINDGDNQEEVSVEFESGNKYVYDVDESTIYIRNTDTTKNIAIARNVKSCNFSKDNQNGKDIIKVHITIGEVEKEVEYILEPERIIYQESEFDYITM